MFTEGSVVSSRVVNTPSSFAKDSLLYVQETGSLRALRRHTSRRSGLSSYLFFTVESGSGALEYCSREYSLSAGDCVFLDCTLPYSHTVGDELWELRWVHFDSCVMEGVYERYMELGGRCVFRPEGGIEPYSALLERIYAQAEESGDKNELKINELLSSLLTMIFDENMAKGGGDASSPAGAVRVVREIKEYLDLHRAEKITLDDIAKRFYINKFYLTKLFRARYGMTVIEYVLKLRITTAKKLLRFSDKRIETIGRECGFDDANYFSRAFRKVEGVTPSRYRTMWTSAANTEK